MKEGERDKYVNKFSWEKEKYISNLKIVCSICFIHISLGERNFSFYFSQSRNNVFSPSPRANSSLMICVATMADSRLSNYSVLTYTCLNLFVSLFFLASPSRFPSSLLFLQRRACNSPFCCCAGKTSCSIPRLRPPTRVSRIILSPSGSGNRVGCLHAPVCAAALLQNNTWQSTRTSVTRVGRARAEDGLILRNVTASQREDLT